MVILEKPYVSDVLARYLSESGAPVLDNPAARAVSEEFPLKLLSGDKFARLVEGGRRLYTTNENSLDWIYQNIDRPELTRAIGAMKDKFALRTLLRPMFPSYAFSETTLDEAQGLDPDALPYPFVLKPSIGFFSVGVHVVAGPDDWRAALDDIVAARRLWRDSYADQVVGGVRFIMEEAIPGDEYAVDAYFDGEGRAVVVDILRHDFSSESDVSDRLYYTSRRIIEDNLADFTAFLDEANRFIGVRDFPVHVELRRHGRRIVPVEFNPLRFAGLCTTDVSHFAFGFLTYDCYLKNRTPDWRSILAGMGDDIYGMMVLDKPKIPLSGKRFDYDALRRDFCDVLSLRPFSGPELPIFGFLFTRTPLSRRDELDRIVRSDLSEYLVPE